jgi:hypothetical protein
VRRSACRWSTNGGLLTVLEQAHGESEGRRFGGACCGLLPIETVVAVKHRLSIHHCKLQIYRSLSNTCFGELIGYPLPARRTTSRVGQRNLLIGGQAYWAAYCAASHGYTRQRYAANRNRYGVGS